MKTSAVELNPNRLVQYLKKPAEEFTKDDIIKYIKENGIKMLTFRYIGGDGRLKALSFVIRNEEHLDNVLSTGERVDGSSLFKYIEADSSDLYVVPKYRTAFVNPFEEIPTLDLLCSYFDKDGNPLASSAENIMKKAHAALKEETGYELNAMAELEYYIISDKEQIDTDFPAVDHQLRKDAMLAIAEAGGVIKYGHSEVGNFTDDKYYYEQNEIEFETTSLEDAADRLLIGKWILRMLAAQYGVSVSYAPKITVGKAGSGLHIHMKLMKDGKTATVENGGKLTDAAKRAIVGCLDVAAAITAFGNRIPTSYLRLVPHQEAPTNICWGDRNRSALIRVPLGWSGDASKMITIANPRYNEELKDHSYKQTYEFRAADGSADIYLLLAGLCVGTRHGLQMDNALELSKKLYIDVNIFKEEHKDRLAQLEHLPASCYESAQALKAKKDIFMQYEVFSEGMLDGIIKELEAFNDYQISEKLYGKTEEIRKLVDNYIHVA
jgi:glutamine synthetase